jgi:hypothetical protein
MKDLETLSLVDLRKILADTIIKAMGRDYALGWLHSAFAYGSRFMDEDRDQLIAQINEFRAREEATITV